MAEQKPRKKVKLYPILSDEQAMKIAKEMTRDWKFPAPPIGTLIKKQAIYLGKYNPIDRDGKSLGKVFNVYAAPEDLPDVSTYVDTVKFMTGLKNWHGFDGESYPTEEMFFNALGAGNYRGGWVIPSLLILRDYIFKNKDQGALRGTFEIEVGIEAFNPNWYWSSTAVEGSVSSIQSVSFSGGTPGRNSKDFYRLSCRPVRLFLSS